MAATLKRPPSPVNPANPETHLLPITPADRRTHGKRLRDTVPRDAHAAWRAHAGREDPICILRAADRTRQAELVPLRYGRMLQSPFAFYRGSAGVMAADLASTPATGIHVQACGDAHLLNFGGFATPERRLIFDINDLDETLPAPWEWDLKRLVVSFVLAARANGLTDNDGRNAAVACAASYRNAMRDFTATDVLVGTPGWMTAIFSRCCRRTRRRSSESESPSHVAQQFGAGVSETRGGDRRGAPHP